MQRNARANQPAYCELSAYTLGHGDPSFIHQHAVDAFTAQTAAAGDKPIRLAFALAGLYLHLERQFTGRQVQLTHMQLARKKQTWPSFDLPENRGAITPADVMLAAAGLERDRHIDDWCASVWGAFEASRPAVVALLQANQII